MPDQIIAAPCLYFTANAEPDMVLANCGCGKCDLKSLLSSGCPQSRRIIPFTYLDTSQLKQCEKDILLLQLSQDEETINNQLLILVDNFNSWMEKNASLDLYKKILLTLPGMAPATNEKRMLSDRKQEINAAKNHLDCFTILSDYYSWFNYSILEKAVNEVNRKTQNDSSEFLFNLESYKDQLHKYCKRNIFECPAPLCMSTTNGITYLVLKVTEHQLSNVNIVSAEQVEIFTAKLMTSFKIPDYVLNLRTVRKGCIELVYSIPQCIYNELFPLNVDQCKSLAMLGVIELTTKDFQYKKDDVSDTVNYVSCITCVLFIFVLNFLYWLFNQVNLRNITVCCINYFSLIRVHQTGSKM